MKITFKSENGFSPEFIHDGVRYFLYEDYDGTWQLMSRKIGFVRKERFYKNGNRRIYPRELLARYFKNKTDYKCVVSGTYTFYYWKGMEFIASGEGISVKYEAKYVRPSFDSYRECLKDAKEYLSKIITERQ